MKTSCFGSLSIVLSLVAVVFFGTGCDIYDTTPLPEQYNSDHVSVFNIRATALADDGSGNAVAPMSFGAFNGSPLVPQGRTVGAYYQISGVRAARFPLGWGCDLTLDYVFDYENADPNSSDSYNNTSLNALGDELVKYSILPIWQAAWDIGYGACTATPTIGIASRPIGSPDVWGKVAAYQANKLNGLIRSYYNADMITRLAEYGWKPGYVEVYPDPTGSGSYGDLGINSVSLSYQAFQTALAEFLPVEDEKRLIGVISPGIMVSDVSEITDAGTALTDFIDDLPANTDYLPDVFSIKPVVNSLQRLISISHTVRQKLDEAGLDLIPLANIDINLNPDTWTDLANHQPTIQNRSAWFGAFTAAAYVRLQGIVDMLIPGRWSTVNTIPSEPWSGEDLYQDETGESMPAMLMLKLVRTFAEEGGEMLNVDNPAATDDPESSETVTGPDSDDIISVAASKRRDGGYQFLVSAINPATSERRGLNMKYVLDVSDLSTGTTGWQVGVIEIDSDSTSFPSKPASRGAATVDNGHVSFSGIIKAPAVHLIKFFPPEAAEAN